MASRVKSNTCCVLPRAANGAPFLIHPSSLDSKLCLIYKERTHARVHTHTLQLVGLDVRPMTGQRVFMANARDRWRGEGCITSVHARCPVVTSCSFVYFLKKPCASEGSDGDQSLLDVIYIFSGGYCGVRWDSGHQDVCLFTGLQNEYHLAASDATADTAPVSQQRAAPDAALPEDYVLSLPTSATHLEGARYAFAGERLHHADLTTYSCDAETEAARSALDLYAASSVAYDGEEDVDLQKRILAQEVVKLRSEVERLQEQKSYHASQNDLASATDQILMLQARKAEIIQGRHKDKRLLRREIEKLMHGNTENDGERSRLSWKDRVELAFETHDEQYKDLEYFVENAAAEYDLVLMLRHLRHSMATTSMRHLAGKKRGSGQASVREKERWREGSREWRKGGRKFPAPIIVFCIPALSCVKACPIDW